MNSNKQVFGWALIAFCCISLTLSLKCYVCNSKDSCKKAQMHKCDEKLAKETLTYLQKNHTGVDVNAIANNFTCLKETIYTSSLPTVWSYYKGCSYSNINACKLPLIPYNNSKVITMECSQCNNKDGCNPAGRVNTDLLSVFMTTLVAVVLRCAWQ